jgi:hypothetical protein
MCCNGSDCFDIHYPANQSDIIIPSIAGCVFINLADPTIPIPLLNVSNISGLWISLKCSIFLIHFLVPENITSYGVVCHSSNQTILERLDFGGLSILLEGFFLTFAAILLIGVGLSTFVEKTENNDAYCFSIKL